MNNIVKSDENLPELIVCAAQKFGDLVIPSIRHFDDVFWCVGDLLDSSHIYLDDFGKKEEGFLTNKQRFITREEAYIIAKENNQIRRLCPTGSSKERPELFSEMLY